MVKEIVFFRQIYAIMSLIIRVLIPRDRKLIAYSLAQVRGNRFLAKAAIAAAYLRFR